MPIEKKGGYIGAEATFCTNEQLTRLDKNRLKRQIFRNRGDGGFLSTSARYLC